MQVLYEYGPTSPSRSDPEWWHFGEEKSDCDSMLVYCASKVGKCVHLVRSCVLEYVRTAFLGTQERRNAFFFKGKQVKGTHSSNFKAFLRTDFFFI